MEQEDSQEDNSAQGGASSKSPAPNLRRHLERMPDLNSLDRFILALCHGILGLSTASRPDVIPECEVDDHNFYGAGEIIPIAVGKSVERLHITYHRIDVKCRL